MNRQLEYNAEHAYSVLKFLESGTKTSRQIEQEIRGPAHRLRVLLNELHKAGQVTCAIRPVYHENRNRHYPTKFWSFVSLPKDRVVEKVSDSSYEQGRILSFLGACKKPVSSADVTRKLYSMTGHVTNHAYYQRILSNLRVLEQKKNVFRVTVKGSAYWSLTPVIQVPEKVVESGKPVEQQVRIVFPFGLPSDFDIPEGGTLVISKKDGKYQAQLTRMVELVS